MGFEVWGHALAANICGGSQYITGKIIFFSHPKYMQDTFMYTSLYCILLLTVLHSFTRSLLVRRGTGSEYGTKLLRPEPTVPTESPAGGSSFGNCIINMDILSNTFRDFYSAHRDSKGICQDYYPTVGNVSTRGLGCYMTFLCANCNMSKRYRLFRDVPEARRGPKRAAVNKQFAFAVQDSSLGMHSACQLLATMDIRAPSASCCQNLASAVNNEMIEINSDDFAFLRDQIMYDNSKRGLYPDEWGEVAISVDSRYNAHHYGDMKKLGLSATHAVTAAVDCLTGKIIECVVENKMCLSGSRQRQHNPGVVCGRNANHTGCTASISPYDNILEGEMNKKLCEKLLDHGLFPAVVTSDNDGQAAKPYQAVVTQRMPGGIVRAQSDPSHLGNSQVRAITKYNFKKETFRCTKFKTVDVLKKLLSRDIKYMSTMILDKCVIRDSAAVVEAAIQCLGGDHTSCLKMKPGHCDGTEDSNWMLSSSLHKAAGVHALEFTESEKEKMRGVFNIRLHDRARDSTALGYHTQQNEAFHRMLSKNSPKNITFARNHHGRVCSTIFRFNHGHSQSIEKKLRAAGCPLYAGGLRTLHTQSIKIGKLKAYQKTDMCKRRRAAARMRSNQHWYRSKFIQHAEHDYIKGQQDPFKLTN